MEILDISNIMEMEVLFYELATLTNGFIKKTRKTPEEEFIRAEKYYSEYVAGKEH